MKKRLPSSKSPKICLSCQGSYLKQPTLVRAGSSELAPDHRASICMVILKEACGALEIFSAGQLMHNFSQLATDSSTQGLAVMILSKRPEKQGL